MTEGSRRRGWQQQPLTMFASSDIFGSTQPIGTASTTAHGSSVAASTVKVGGLKNLNGLLIQNDHLSAANITSIKNRFTKQKGQSHHLLLDASKTSRNPRMLY